MAIACVAVTPEVIAAAAHVMPAAMMVVIRWRQMPLASLNRRTRSRTSRMRSGQNVGGQASGVVCTGCGCCGGEHALLLAGWPLTPLWLHLPLQGLLRYVFELVESCS